MSVHIIIDGYNLIRQSAELGELERIGVELSREALLDRLRAYKKMKAHAVTVVFDGTEAPGPAPRAASVKGVRVRYSRQGEDADAVIKRMAARERERAVIVTSDQEIARFSESKGAAVVSAPAFEEKMNMAGLVDGSGGNDGESAGWVPTTKKKGPSRRPPKRRRGARRKIKKL